MFIPAGVSPSVELALGIHQVVIVVLTLTIVLQGAALVAHHILGRRDQKRLAELEAAGFGRRR